MRRLYYDLRMRLLLLTLLFSACAAHHPTAKTNSAPPSEPPLDSVKLRACESCRHDLELCKRDLIVTQEATPPSVCMDKFMSCIALQQLDLARCAGMN